MQNHSKAQKQCNAAVYLLFDSASDNVIIYRTENGHKHDINNMSKEAIPIFLKTEINKMCDLLMKPKRILRNLVDNGHQIQMKQLQNYITAYKKKKYGSTSISLGELEQWYIDNNNVPNSEDESFIVNYKIFYSDGSDVEQENDDIQDNSKFRIFVSAKRLLC